ncbi:hypothetical protein [Longispora albida]|uniref:hypothetical protein n=1 Tax=Longispora albida TaxID=203523 RepID=UPI00036B1275|nr:hypothetical protein [Longispora albida]
MLSTATALGTLDTLTDGERDRISGLRLDGDGAYVYWMTPGEMYRISHDGRGWVVSGGGWFTPGRPYRLTRAGLAIRSLPIVFHGEEKLNPFIVYQVSTGYPSGWELWALT